MTAARAEQRAEDQALVELARDDPTAALRRVHTEMASAVVGLLRKWNARGGEPPRGVIDAARELRHLSEDVRDRVLAAFGPVEQAGRALEDLDRAVAELTGATGQEAAPAEGTPEEDTTSADRVLRDLWAEVQRGVLRCSRDWSRLRGEPSRASLEASRELRMLASVIDELHGSGDQGTAWRRFLGEDLPGRIEVGRERIGEPRPVVDPSGA
jgi:hypothetical protein